MRSFVLTSTSNDPAITADTLTHFAVTLQLYLQQVAQWWERQAWAVGLGNPTDPSTIKAIIQDDLPSAPGALAYHTDDNGQPVVLMGWGLIKQNGGTLSGKGGLLSAIAHEFAETFVDPWCSFFAQLDVSTLIAQEVCDPVQGDDYEVNEGSGLFVSNFVGPRYFNFGGPGAYDVMKLCTSPLELRPGGYMTKYSLSGGEPSTVFGKEMPDWMCLAKHASQGRTYKRNAKAMTFVRGAP